MCEKKPRSGEGGGGVSFLSSNAGTISNKLLIGVGHDAELEISS